VHSDYVGLGRVEGEAAAQLGVPVECDARNAHVALPFPRLLLLLHHLPRSTQTPLICDQLNHLSGQAVSILT
jgi:hypothetical protein